MLMLFTEMSLQIFIQDLHAEECAFKLDPEVIYNLEKSVTTVVKDIIPGAFNLFPRSKGRFSVAEVSNAGSYYEQTKIIAPNEYDFMLVIRELSEPDAIELQKGCREGYVKVKTTNQDRWGFSMTNQTPDRSFQIAVLEFNSYVRQAVELFDKGLQPVQDEYGVLLFKNVLSRGKPYKQFSYVQTAYFEWKYKKPCQSVDSKRTRHYYSRKCKADEPQPSTSRGNTSDQDMHYTTGRTRSSDTSVNKATFPEIETLYSRRNASPSLKERVDDDSTDRETLELDIDLMACCWVPVSKLEGFLPEESLQNPCLIKNGCHIVLKPCGNPTCIEEDTECRLISYTKSEQEVMRNLHPNWKTVYKFFKWLFHFTEILGVDSYKLKTAILHLQKEKRGDLEVDDCMRLLLKHLLRVSSKNKMPSFFNPNLNVWNVAPCYKYFVKWEVQLIYHLISLIDSTNIKEYNYKYFRHIFQVKIERFCLYENVSKLVELEQNSHSSEFQKFCIQGNTFLDIVRGMEEDLQNCKRFKTIAFKLKCRVLVDVMWEITRAIVSKCFCLLKGLVSPPSRL